LGRFFPANRPENHPIEIMPPAPHDEELRRLTSTKDVPKEGAQKTPSDR
jgi:hypothetical protein